MQSIAPLTVSDFIEKAKEPVSKLEIFIDPDWINLCDLGGKNFLISATFSSGQKEFSYCPVAATFSAVLDDTDGNFNPKNDTGLYNTYLKAGRKIRFATGFKKDAVDYFWQWFIGSVSEVRIRRSNNRITIKGFDYTQYLTEVELKSPDNYWGTPVTKSVIKDQAGYEMPGACKGIYIVHLDGVQIYSGDYWVYDEDSNYFFFLPSKIPGSAGTDNLIISYYTTQVPEEVVADLLVIADLYVDQAAALAAMDYTATGITIDRVRFDAGTKTLYAIQKMCERTDYEFFFKYSGIPLFKPII